MGTFFTPAEEMGLALHELYKVSGPVMGDAPYEEYVPTSEELHLLTKEDPQVYEIYREVSLPYLRADILLEEQKCQADVLGELSVQQHK